MTVEEIQKFLAEITAKRLDDEMAHEMEDKLHQSVLRAIADNQCSDPTGCAAAALTSLDIDFARWCA